MGGIALRRMFAVVIVPFVSTLVLWLGLPDAGAISRAPPCARSSVLCVAVVRPPGGPRLLVIGGPKAKYFSSYQLCVRAPDGTRECHRFSIALPKHGYFFSAIAWRRHFAKEGPGRYIARWRELPSRRLIGTRRFTVR